MLYSLKVALNECSNFTQVDCCENVFLVYRLVYGTPHEAPSIGRRNTRSPQRQNGRLFRVELWCNCCSAIQLARHTHGEHKYPTNAASKTD
jgi:hypothetical protein